MFKQVQTLDRNTLSLTNYTFDIFGLEYGLPLITGSKICLSSINSVSETEIATSYIIQQTPSTLLQLVNKFPNSLSNCLCLVGGEALQNLIAKELYKAFKHVFNVYGPAETVIWSTTSQICDLDNIHIGSPLFNENVYVLDDHGTPVPIGVVGELHIAGAGVARGYLNMEE
ncbi:AMP-binding protein, partial [Croceitalea sp. MTPC5]|uniref:AMP-binding protein n=1 Tax=Croceitalea sp. MTPC5 TaxID=3056565 RepID=UPI0030D19990